MSHLGDTADLSPYGKVSHDGWLERKASVGLQLSLYLSENVDNTEQPRTVHLSSICRRGAQKVV